MNAVIRSTGDLVPFESTYFFLSAKYDMFSGIFLAPVCLGLRLHVSTMSSFPGPYSVNSFHSRCHAIDLPVLVRRCSITTKAANNNNN